MAACSGPRSRSAAARVCSCSRRLSACRPAAEYASASSQPDRYRVPVRRAEQPLPLRDRLLVERDRVRQPVGRLQRAGHAHPRGHRVRVQRTQRALAVGQHPLDHGERLGQPPGGGVGVGQPVPGQHRLRVRGPEQVAAGPGDRLPVADGGVCQCRRLGQRPSGPQQRRVGLRLPQPLAGERAQRGRAVPQRLTVFRRRRGRRPGLEQRGRRRLDDLVESARCQVGADRGANAGVQPDRARRVRRVDRRQPELLQGGVSGLDLGLLGGAGVGPAGDVTARGGGREHRRRNAAGVEDGRESEGRPGQAGRRHFVCVLDRERPGGEQGLRAALDDRGRGAPQPLGVLDAVVPAGALGHDDHRGRLGDGDRQPVDVLGQVERLDPLVGEADEPRVEVADRLAPAEPGDAVGDPARAVQLRRGQPGGHHDLAGRPLRPEPNEVGGRPHVVEHDRPALAGAPQPAEEPLRPAVGGLLGGGEVQVGGRLRVAGDDRGPVARGHPDQQVNRPARPHRVREADGELGLAGAVGRARRRRAAAGGLACRRDQQDGRARAQAVGQPEPGLLAGLEVNRQGRHRSGQDRRGCGLRAHWRRPSPNAMRRGHHSDEIALVTAFLVKNA